MTLFDEQIPYNGLLQSDFAELLSIQCRRNPRDTAAIERLLQRNGGRARVVNDVVHNGCAFIAACEGALRATQQHLVSSIPVIDPFHLLWAYDLCRHNGLCTADLTVPGFLTRNTWKRIWKLLNPRLFFAEEFGGGIIEGMSYIEFHSFYSRKRSTGGWTAQHHTIMINGVCIDGYRNSKTRAASDCQEFVNKAYFLLL